MLTTESTDAGVLPDQGGTPHSARQPGSARSSRLPGLSRCFVAPSVAHDDVQEDEKSFSSSGWSPKGKPFSSSGWSPKDKPSSSSGWSPKGKPSSSSGWSPKGKPSSSSGWSPRAWTPKAKALFRRGSGTPSWSSKGSILPAIQVTLPDTSLAGSSSNSTGSPCINTDIASSGAGTPPPSPSSARAEELAPTAMSLNRPYTMADWHTMVAYVREHGSDVFYDARSCASSVSSTDWGEPDAPAAAASTSRGAAARQAASAAIPRSLVPKGAAAPWTPQPALEWADPSWEYRPVDARAFYGFWRRCMTRSTPAPFATDIALRVNPITRAVHESVHTLEMRESVDRRCLELVLGADVIPFPGLLSYIEKFPLDGSECTWAMRRDVTSLGRSTGQVYMTTDGILITRVYSHGMFSRTPDWFAEDVMQLEDGGRTLVALLGAKDLRSQRRGHVFMIATRE